MPTDSDDQPPDPPGRVIERWVFGGSRIGSTGRRVHAWIDPSGEELWYAPHDHPAIGSVYEVSVARTDTKLARGRPTYTGQRSEDTELVDRLAALHRAAETTLALRARERAAKKDDPTELAITRLVELARHVPANQRTAFAAYVTTRLVRAWSQ